MLRMAKMKRMINIRTSINVAFLQLYGTLVLLLCGKLT